MGLRYRRFVAVLVLLWTSPLGAEVFTYRVNPQTSPTLSFSRFGPFLNETVQGLPVSRLDDSQSLFARGDIRGEIDFTVDEDTVTISRFDLTVHSFSDLRDLGLRPSNEGPPPLPPIADGTPLSDLLAENPVGLSGTLPTEPINPAFRNPAAIGLFGPVVDQFSPSNVGAAELFTSFIFAGVDFLDGNFSIEPVLLSTTEVDFEIDNPISSGGDTITLTQSFHTFAPSLIAVPEPSAIAIGCLVPLVAVTCLRRRSFLVR